MGLSLQVLRIVERPDLLRGQRLPLARGMHSNVHTTTAPAPTYAAASTHYMDQQ